MKLIYSFCAITFFLFTTVINAQKHDKWNGKQCAVVLTYDDALNVHLDHVIPCLDSGNLKGTFYLQGESPVIKNRMNEWRLASENGHELGNHSLTHPCTGQLKGREWVSDEKDLSKYSVYRAVNEILITNTLLQAIDGKQERTFAYPCGDAFIDTVNYYESLQNEFVGARGVKSGMQHINEVDLKDIQCYMMNGQTGAEMIDLVKQATKTHTLLVFLFHGVGGEHSLNVSLEAHQELIQYLAKQQKKIWVAPLAEVAAFIKKEQDNI
ncbi:polysaccharide deacetylase family protein [Plebeiibacterium sediminum]|uniref:Polysaccharide deacetylase family protein n=1 Tax=Plebeiibacterium sediminum TaxID=2992112 RepID=A0AAE3M294_9BACT|nr:polysaccharide deacetylase family protein [Plebeiobacterium sediminum]MCW3785480.1 polysaccharide deacetylase family protein [Plebeiobacterium sediminum]